MNSQGLSPKIRKLYYDIEDGCNILYVMDKVKPGCVDHKRINKPPYKALAALPKKIENCNYAIDLGKKLNFSLVGVAGNDILDHNPTLTLALLWQMMRAYTVKVRTLTYFFTITRLFLGKIEILTPLEIRAHIFGMNMEFYIHYYCQP